MSLLGFSERQCLQWGRSPAPDSDTSEFANQLRHVLTNKTCFLFRAMGIMKASKHHYEVLKIYVIMEVN